MDEQPQFQMIIVTRKRRRSPSDAPKNPAESPEQGARQAARPDGGAHHPREGEHHHHHEGEHHHHHEGEHHHHHKGEHLHHHEGEHHHHHKGEHHHRDGERRHHRHYRDYGSINLGDLPEAGSEEDRQLTEVNAALARRTEEQLQEKQKFAPILTRKYRKRGHFKLVLGILLAVVLIAILVLVRHYHMQEQSNTEETVATLEPLESVNIDDLVN